jgi:hypothetical protein
MAIRAYSVNGYSCLFLLMAIMVILLMVIDG